MFLKCSSSKRMFPDMLHQENVTSQCFRPIKTKKFDKVDVSFLTPTRMSPMIENSRSVYGYVTS